MDEELLNQDLEFCRQDGNVHTKLNRNFPSNSDVQGHIFIKHELPWFYQLAIPAILGLQQGIARRKVEVPSVPRSCGGVVTND